MPLVLWRCWLGGRKCIWPVKNWVVGCWRGYLSGARCRLAYGPDDATSTHCLLLQYNPDWFTFLVPAHPGIPGQRAIKWVCVCGINTIVHLYTAVRLTSVVTDYFFCAVNFVAENTFLSFIIGPLSPVRWSQLFKQCVSHVDVVAWVSFITAAQLDGSNLVCSIQ